MSISSFFQLLVTTARVWGQETLVLSLHCSQSSVSGAQIQTGAIKTKTPGKVPLYCLNEYTAHCVTQFKLKYTSIKQSVFSITTNTWRKAPTNIKNTLPDFTCANCVESKKYMSNALLNMEMGQRQFLFLCHVVMKTFIYFSIDAFC